MAEKEDFQHNDPFSGQEPKKVAVTGSRSPLANFNPGEKQPTIPEIIAALKSFIPEENFRKEPETSTTALLSLENEYKVSTTDAIHARVELPEEVREEWLNHFENFVLFGGDLEKINQ